MTEPASGDGGWTPGPWCMHPFSAVVVAIVPCDHTHRPIGAASAAARDLATYAQEICQLHWPDRHRKESEVQANARLIAAAPDLYEALETAVLALIGMHIATNKKSTTAENATEAGQAILAKARGE